MKRLFFLLSLSILVVVSSCEKTNSDIPVGNKIKLDSVILNNFYEDALELYLREIYSDSSHKNYNNPILDTNEINKILAIIQTVYNVQSAQRDTIFDIHKIHAFRCNLSRSITIAATVDAPEIKNLSKHIIPTDNIELDKILSDYKFDSVYVSPYYPSSTSFLTLYTTEVFNLIPIEKQLKNIPSIFIAEINNGCIGDENDISLIRNKDTALVNFSIGWGDCPSGCIHRRSWVYKVVDSLAEFIKVTQR